MKVFLKTLPPLFLAVLLGPASFLYGANVNVTVNAASALRTLPDTLFGQNMSVYDGSATAGNTNYVNALGAMGSINLRFPGGSWSDGVDWNNLEGGVATGCAGGTWIINISEGIAFANAANVHLQCIVNYGGNWCPAGGGPSHANAVSKAVSWVNYMNKGAGNHKVTYWEVGNEIFGNWELGYEANGTNYGNNFVDFYNQMKAADNTIKVGAICQAETAWMPWSEAAMTAIKGKGVTPDFLICHAYPLGSPADTTAVDSQLLGAEVDAATTRTTEMNTILTTAGYAANSIPFWMTEYRSTQPEVKTVEWVDAMWSAQYLLELGRNGWQGANIWAIKNGFNTGNNSDYGLLRGGSGNTDDTPVNNPRPSWYIFPFLSKVFGRNLVSTTTSQASQRCWASKDAAGNLTIFLVNNDTANSNTVNITLSGFSAGTAGNIWTLAPAGTTKSGATTPIQELRWINVNGTQNPAVASVPGTGNALTTGASFSVTVPAANMVLIKVPAGGPPPATNTPTRTPTSTPTRTNTPAATNTPTRTNSATNTVSRTATNSPTRTATQTPTNTAANTATNSPTRTPSNTMTATLSSTRTSTPTSTNTPTRTATNTSTNTVANTPSNTPSRTPTLTTTNTAILSPSRTPTLTPTNTLPAATNTATNSPSSTPSRTPTSSSTQTTTNSFTRTATASSTATPTNTLANSATPTNTRTNTASSTPSNTPSNSSTATATRTATNSATPTVSSTFTNSPTGTAPPTNTATNSPSITPSATPTRTATFSPSATPSRTPSYTPSNTPSDTATLGNTSTSTATRTPSATASRTATSTSTQTGTNTASSTPTRTATTTPTNSPANTATHSFTPTETFTSTDSPTGTVPPTSTATNSPSNTPTATASNSPTRTGTATPTRTPTLTFTRTATNSPSVTSTLTDTPLLTFTPTATSVTVIITNGSSAPGNSTQLPGTLNVPVLQFQLTNLDSAPLTLSSLTLTASGSGNDATGIAFVSLYWDSNGNGVVDASDTLLSTAVFSGNNGSAVLNFTADLPASVSRSYLAAYSFSGSANGTFQASIANNAGLSGSNGTGAVLFNGAPLTGALITVAPATSTPTSTATQTVTMTASPTNSATPSLTASPTPTFTRTATKTFTFTPLPSSTFTPTPSFTSTSTVNPTGTPGKPVMIIYPNPAPGPTVNILPPPYTGWSDVNVKMFTTAFRKVQEANFSQVPNGTAVPVDLTDKWGTPLASGIYYVVVNTSAGKSVGKLFVRR